MRNNKKIPERHTTMAHGEDFGSLPNEEALSQLMKEFDMSREEAEAVLQRDRTHLRRHAVNRLSEEEFSRLEEEAANSPSVLTLSWKGDKKQRADDTEHDDV